MSAEFPTSLLGFDIGTLNVKRIVMQPSDDDTRHHLSDCRIDLRTFAGMTRLAKDDVTDDIANSPGTIEWDDTIEHGEKLVRLPVRKRYGSALVIAFREHTSLRLVTKTRAVGVLWLRDIKDLSLETVRVPLWAGGDLNGVQQNYYPCQDVSDDTAQFSNIPPFARSAKLIGHIDLSVLFEPGLSNAHEHNLDVGNPHLKNVWEEFDRMQAGGLRTSITKKPPRALRRDSEWAESRQNTIVPEDHIVKGGNPAEPDEDEVATNDGDRYVHTLPGNHLFLI